MHGARRSGRLFPRLLLTVVAAFVPFALVLTALLVKQGSDGIARSVDTATTSGARALASRTDDYLQNRLRDLRFAAAAVDGLPADEAQRELRLLERLRGGYDTIALLDGDGREKTAAPA